MSSCITSFPAKLPHFCKIILSDNFQDAGLRIPSKFMKEQEKNMSNQICLHVPSGGLWQVELTNTKNGEVWLKKGWHQFANHYSIRYGYFLVFGYEGNSVFSVIIFDHSATEIQYPSIQTSNRDFQKGAESIQTVDLSKRKESPVAYFLRSKKEKIDSVIKSEQGKLDEKFKGCPTTMNEAIKMEIDEGTWLQEARVKKVGDNMAMEMKTQRSDHSEKCMKALGLANAFISKIKKNPFFSVTMKPSHVTGRYRQSVPKSFVVRYMSKEHNDSILQVSDGRSWPVKCTVYSGCAKVVHGWKKFAQDNALKAGDVCVFELISNIDNLMKVSIFQA